MEGFGWKEFGSFQLRKPDCRANAYTLQANQLIINYLTTSMIYYAN